MREYTILERIINVYDKSIKIVNNSNDKNESIKIVTTNSDEIKSIELSSVNELPSHNYSHPEIEGNYLLFFNNTYNKLVRKYIKKILKRIAWPILKRQVFFNATIRQILYGLVQKNHELSFKEEENSSYLHVLNEKIDKINLSAKELEKISNEIFSNFDCDLVSPQPNRLSKNDHIIILFIL